MQKETHKKKKRTKSFKATKKGKRKSAQHKDKVVQELSAGGIVFRKTTRSVQFAIMKDSYGKWAFPKGHVEQAEELEEGAARETLEELGLEEIRLVDYLGKIDIWFRDRYKQQGALIHKDIHYFLFSAAADAELRPDPQEHVYDAKWVSAKKLLELSSYPDMVPILTRALELVAPTSRNKRS